MATIEPILLDFRQAGELLGVTHWTVRNLVWSGELAFVRLGRKFMLDRRDLLAWVERTKECNKN
jgi:excisionase family DNA binding protein